MEIAESLKGERVNVRFSLEICDQAVLLKQCEGLDSCKCLSLSLPRFLSSIKYLLHFVRQHPLHSSMD